MRNDDDSSADFLVGCCIMRFMRRLQDNLYRDLDEVSYPGRGLFWLGCPGGKILLSIY